MTIKFQAPNDALLAVATRAKAKRLSFNLSRRTLSINTGVSEASIKRFETTGEVGFHSLLKVAYALKCMEEFEHLFREDAPDSISDLQSTPKRRGTR